MKITKSIVFRFSLMSIFCILLVIGGFGLYNYKQTRTTLENQLDTQVNLILSQVQLNVPSLMWDVETERLQTVLNSLAQNRIVAALYVVDNAGKIYGVRRNAMDQVETITAKPRNLEIYKSKKLIYDKSGSVEPLGTSYLAVSRHAIEEHLNELAASVIFQTSVLAIVLVALLFFGLRIMLLSPILEIRKAIDNIASGDGDLTQRLKRRDDEVGIMVDAFNSFIESLQGLITGVLNCSKDMQTPVSTVNMVAKQTQQGAENQRLKSNRASAAMRQMAHAAGDVANSASMASDSAKTATENAQAAEHELQGMTQSIHSLAEDISAGATVINSLQDDVNNIVSVLDVIRGIAEQTNLLALNAAIEAARAGEQGRGFAVVADEVRSLASKTQDSTQEIQDMITRLQEGSAKAVDVMQIGKQSGEKTLEKVSATQGIVGAIYQAIVSVNDMNSQIASAAEEQTAVSEEVTTLLTGIVEVVEQVVADAGETYESSEKLMSIINDFNNQIYRFKV